MNGLGWLVLGALASGQTSAPSVEVTPILLRTALHCMEQEATGESVRSFSGIAGYRVRYLAGVEDANVDRSNELHIVSYSGDGQTAWLYELIVDERPRGGYTMTWINSAQLALKNSQWTVLDTLGGIWSSERVYRLVNAITARPMLSVPFGEHPWDNVRCLRH